MRILSQESLWGHLYWLSVLAEQGSFTRAAERLEVSKAAMSQKIKELEQQAGVPLVRRTTRSMQLTDAGQKLVEDMREPFAQIAQSFIGVRDSHGPIRGRIRVTAPVAFARQQLLTLIMEFLHLHPAVRIQLEVTDRLVSLASEGFDLAIRHSDILPETHVAQKLCATQTLIVASPHYLQYHGEPATPAALVEHQCLYYPRGIELPHWSFQHERDSVNSAENVTVAISGSFATNNSESIRDAALAGMGIALLPDFSAAAALKSGQLIRLFPDWQSVGAFAESLHVIRPWASQVPRVVTLFSAYLRQAFKDNLTRGFIGHR